MLQDQTFNHFDVQIFHNFFIFQHKCPSPSLGIIFGNKFEVPLVQARKVY
jgi:hypothetical protein